MKIANSPFFLIGATLISTVLVGCGGGGSSNGPGVAPTAAPVPTATPRPQTGVTVSVQLRDTNGAPVEGLVTLGAQRRATTGGAADFFNAPAGTLVASADVNGVTYSKSFVATFGANTVQIAIDPAVGGTMGGTPPAPPPF